MVPGAVRGGCGAGSGGAGGGFCFRQRRMRSRGYFAFFNSGPPVRLGFSPVMPLGLKRSQRWVEGADPYYLFGGGGGGGGRGGLGERKGGKREEREGGKERRAEKEVASWGRNPALGYGRRKFPLAGVAQGARRGVGAGWSPFVCAGACGARGPSCPGFLSRFPSGAPGPQRGCGSADSAGLVPLRPPPAAAVG